MSKKCIKIIWLLILFVTYSVYAQLNNCPHFTDPAKNITVQKPNQEFDIILKSNPTTGYSWELKKYDAKIIAKVQNKFYPPFRTDPQLVGAPGYEKWTFKVINQKLLSSSQETSITMVYRRPWEKENPDDQTLTFRVVNKHADKAT